MFPLGSAVTDAEKKETLISNDSKKSYGITLWYWAFIQFILTSVILALVGGLSFTQSFGGSTVKITTSRLGIPITQTLGVWVNSSTMKRHTFDDLVFGDGAALSTTCSTYGMYSSTISTMYVRPVILSTSIVDIRYFIGFYYLLSFICQIASLLATTSYYRKFNDGKNNLAGSIEQSLTTPFLFTVLCTQVGITDVCILINVAANMFAFSVFQLIGETLFEDKSEYGSVDMWPKGSFFFYAIAHVSGWFTLLCAYATILINMSASRTCMPASDTFTSLTTMMILIEMVCFLATHIIQFISMKIKPRPVAALIDEYANYINRIDPTYNIEFASIIIGIISKLTFGILIYIANLS